MAATTAIGLPLSSSSSSNLLVLPGSISMAIATCSLFIADLRCNGGTRCFPFVYLYKNSPNKFPNDITYSKQKLFCIPKFIEHLKFSARKKYKWQRQKGMQVM